MPETLCQGCGVPLPPSKGRPRKWCGERCRKGQYAGACADCGAVTDGNKGPARAPTRCQACTIPFAAAHAARRATRDVRNHVTHTLWHEGFTIREIATTLNTTPESIRVRMARMRGDGWDVPYRYLRPTKETDDDVA